MFSGHRLKALFVGAILGSMLPQLATAASGTFSNELWSVVIRESTDICPAIGPDGTIYLGTFRGKLWAISAAGKKKWVFQAGREIRSSPALGSDGTIYFGCRDKKFYAVSPKGRLKWNFATGGWVDSSPAVGSSGDLYFGSWDGRFYALDSQGTKKWEFQTGGPIVSSPALGPNGRIYFGSHDRKFYAVTPDGAKAWEYGTGGSIISSPAIDGDGTLYFTSVDGVFHAVKPDGTAKWRLRTGGITESSPVIGQGGMLYVGVNQELWAIDARGDKMWYAPWGETLEPIRTTPVALADESVLFLPGYGTLARLSNTNAPVCVKNPNVMDSVYLAFSTFTPALSSNATLYAVAMVENVGCVLKAFRAEVSLAKSPWPKFRSNAENTGRLQVTSP